MWCYYSILTPLQASGILIWYIVREISENEEEKWYKFTRGSLFTVLTEVRWSEIIDIIMWFAALLAAKTERFY